MGFIDLWVYSINYKMKPISNLESADCCHTRAQDNKNKFQRNILVFCWGYEVNPRNRIFGINYIKNGLDKLNFTMDYIKK